METREQVKALIEKMSEGVYEKEHIIAMSLLAAIAGESIFLLGPPGTAKSMVARRLKSVFSTPTVFEYLMSRFSTPDELFGPVSIVKLKNEDVYERRTDGYLPTATVVFLDEIWKAGPSIQNALLTVINERIFQNGQNTMKVKMKVLIAASNELPAEDEGLEALWDRFLIREVSNCISSEKTFYKMLRQRGDAEVTIPERLLITDQRHEEWKTLAAEVDIPDEILHQITYVRKRLAEQKGEGLDYYISDRRWRKIVRLMQVSALLNGRKAIDNTDISILFHTIWNKTETIPTILDIVAESYMAAFQEKMKRCHSSIEKVIKQITTEAQQIRRTDSANDEFEVTGFFYYIVEKHPKGACLFAKVDYNYIQTNRDTKGIIYYDEGKQSWIIHALITNTKFNAKKTSNQFENVRLRRCRGGLIIDGVPYQFRRREGQSQGAEQRGKTPVDTVMENVQQLRNQFTTSSEKMNDRNNIFMSEDDHLLIKKRYEEFGKQLDELEVKMENTTMMI